MQESNMLSNHFKLFTVLPDDGPIRPKTCTS